MPTDQQEWSAGNAFIRAIIGQFVRLPLTAGIAFGLLYLASPTFEWTETLPSRSIPIISVVVAALAVIPSAVLAKIIHWKLTDMLGFEGPIAALIGYAHVCAAVFGGYWVCDILGRSGTSVYTIAVAALLVETAILVTWATWINPD